MDTNWELLDTPNKKQFQQRKCIFHGLKLSTQTIRHRPLKIQVLNKCVKCSNTQNVRVVRGTQWPRVAEIRTASSYHQGYQAQMSWGWRSRKVKMPIMLSVMTRLCVWGAIPQLSNMRLWRSAHFKHMNCTCLEVAAFLLFSWSHYLQQEGKHICLNLQQFRLHVKQFVVMSVFTFELKYTRTCVYTTTDVTPFHVQCFPWYNGMTSLRVAQGDGLRIRKVAGSVSIKQLRTADKGWLFGIWFR